MTGKTLYELVDQLKFLESIEDEGEDDKEKQERLKSMLDTVKLDIEEKVTNIGKFVISLKGSIDILNAEEKRLYTRRQALNNKVEWLKSYLLNEMHGAMIREVKSEVCNIYIRINPPSVSEFDMKTLSEQFIRIIPETREPDKKAIIDYFKSTGEIVPGVVIETTKESIVIR